MGPWQPPRRPLAGRVPLARSRGTSDLGFPGVDGMAVTWV